MSISSSNQLIIIFLTHNVIIANQFGCFTVVRTTRKLSNYMKVEGCLHNLQLIQNDKLLSYEELLEKDWQVSVHHRNIQSLAIEMLQIKHGQSREIVTNIFTQVTKE